MSDAITRLNAALEGRYKIERQLGEGGMATVYLARDERHNRNVALKVLKPELAAVVGADRFLAEIETTANLQHPHILPLFDSGEADGFLFYVMPYVEGESLRERLDREHQLPVDEAVQIASDVAEALQAAHDQGVIHRDVKPANILLSKGRPLVSDFGIALAVGAAGGGRLTETGLSLGTPHYMSPEQATGDLSVGASTDIYALGCVLYEMLVGEPPFTGSTPQAVLGKIVTGEAPSASAERKSVPSHVDAAIRTALEKVPADRFVAARELASALGDEGFWHRAVSGDSGAPSARVMWAKYGGVALGGVLLGGLVIGILSSGARVPEPRATYVSVSLPEGVTIQGTIGPHFGPALAVSPSGREVVFAGEQDGERLYRLSLDDDSGVQPIPGTDGGQAPFYSSDGAWITFAAGTRLLRVPSGGGVPTEMASVIGFRGGVWTPDDALLYYVPTAFTGIWRLSADGGAPEQITEPAYDGFDMSHMWPALLPNGDLLFTSCCADIRTFVLPSADPARTPEPILSGGGARYVPSGHLVFMQRENVMVAQYDPGSREVGPYERVLDRAITSSEMVANIGLSSLGTAAYFAGRSDFQKPLTRIRRDGSRDALPLATGSHAFPLHFSPDGRRFLYSTYHPEGMDLFAYEMESQRTARLTTHPSNDYSPIWGPGASHITFTSLRAGQVDVYTKNVATGDEAQVLVRDGSRKWPLSWTADGAWLLYTITSDTSGEDVWVYSAEADSAWALLDERYNEFPAAFAPSGGWLAYARDDTNPDREVWAMAFPDGVPCQISVDGGNRPAWSQDGRRLYYVKSDTLMLAAAPEGGSICDARSRPHLIGIDLVWGLAPDEGYVVTASAPPKPELRIIIDWDSELRASRSP
jgi:Tol biopolymer transport system component